MYEASLFRPDLIDPLGTDSLPPRSYPYHRSAKDGSLLRTTAETERYRRVRGRDLTHTSTMAPNGLLNRIVRNLCALW